MTRQYNYIFPFETLTVDSLKTMSASLYINKMSTGDPLLPPEVRYVRLIRHLTSARAEISGAKDAE